MPKDTRLAHFIDTHKRYNVRCREIVSKLAIYEIAFI